MKIYIRNMACESCKVVVKEALDELKIPALKIDLGEIETKKDITLADKKRLNSKIKKAGLELLEKRQGILIEKIRKEIINYIYESEEKPIKKFSVLLSEKLNHSYRYLSNFFSEVEATTIEQYIIALKIERIKELILLEEDGISEIADKLHYSSVAHLSNQFKKVTGLSPSHFKRLKNKRRLTIQEL
ncbi:helix-turn-helix domain-containing protein [Ferruginibacter sp. SUN002]|uniref:helix-turn-helix domain-containing protein n=1 Tax=Ferruginibacter sp. SUN002 TaxID=2937789 RepID=UPI003D367F92